MCYLSKCFVCRIKCLDNIDFVVKSFGFRNSFLQHYENEYSVWASQWAFLFRWNFCHFHPFQFRDLFPFFSDQLGRESCLANSTTEQQSPNRISFPAMWAAETSHWTLRGSARGHDLTDKMRAVVSWQRQTGGRVDSVEGGPEGTEMPCLSRQDFFFKFTWNMVKFYIKNENFYTFSEMFVICKKKTEISILCFCFCNCVWVCVLFCYFLFLVFVVLC